MKFNARFSTKPGLVILALLITMSLAAEAKSDHVYGYVDGVDQPLVECSACSAFKLDREDPAAKLITESQNLAVRLITPRSMSATKLVFQFTGPSGEQLGEITQPIEQLASRTQIFHLTKETTNALQEHIGKGNHLKVTVEMKTSRGKEKMRLQLVSLSKIRS